MSAYTGPEPPGDLTESDMIDIRQRNRQMLLQQREEALQARRDYELESSTSLTVSRETHLELATAAMRFHDVLRPLDHDRLDCEFPAAEWAKDAIFGTDDAVYEHPDTTPERFAELVDDLDDVAHQLGFVPEVER